MRDAGMMGLLVSHRVLGERLSDNEVETLLVMRHLDFSHSLGIRCTHLLRFWRLVLIFFQAESVITEQVGLFLFEVCGRLLHTKVFIVLAPE